MQNPINRVLLNSNLFNKSTPLLIACSGGRDSMVLLSSFIHCEFDNIHVAHCNFKLRNDASDKDQKLVKDFCSAHNISFHTIDFETSKFAKEHGISTQMAARELRYNWLEEIRLKHQLHLIISAHHRDDQVETVLLQLIQGTGIRGLKGMLHKNDKIVRPLLSISRDEINQYAEEFQVPYRDDSSNESNDYKRNFIRNKISPLLKEINNNYSQEIYDFTQRIQESIIIYDAQIDKIRKKVLVPWKEGQQLYFTYLLHHPACDTLFYELLSPFNLNKEQVKEVAITAKGLKRKNASGQNFYSKSHRLVMDKKSIFILPLDTPLTSIVAYDKWPNKIIFNEYKIDIDIKPIRKAHINKSNRYAFIDADKVEFPILIRYPEVGDYFYPYGMGKQQNPDKVGKKKLSKYFKDEKISLAERERTPILFSNQRAVWLVHHRIDDRFKVTEDTKNVVQLSIQQS